MEATHAEKSQPRRRSKVRPIPSWLRILRLILRSCLLAYIVVFALSLLLTRYMAESWWVTTLALYAAPTIWLLPMAVLIPAALFLERKQLLVYPILVFSLLFGHMGWKPGKGGDPSEGNLVVLSNNVGQRGGTSFRNYQKKIVPEIILLQEVGGRVYKYERSFPGYQSAASGEFGILSRYPILSAEPVPGLELPVASRFRVAVDGNEILFYNIHLPTPRTNFQQLRGNGFLHSAVTAGGFFSAKVRSRFQDFMDRNFRLATQIAEAATSEDLPVILAGDFNAPAQGKVARLFASKFQDAHLNAGGGFGFTFPGVTRNPLSLFGPWMRIDHIYSNQWLRAVGCKVETKRASQHRAVAAGFDLYGL